jgi:hypothetical protein
MKFALLMVWLGSGTAQTFDLTRFDTMAECRASLDALRATHSRLDGEWVRCIEVTVPDASPPEGTR